MGRRPDRHRYGSKGEYLGGSSDDSPLAKMAYRAVGLVVIVAVVLAVFRGCQ